MSERPYSREIAWLRVAVWTIPGIAILLIFRYGETFLSPSGVRAGESYLILLAIAVSIFSCGTCDALLWRKQHADYATSLAWRVLCFCFWQLILGPLIAGILFFASCVFQIGGF